MSIYQRYLSKSLIFFSILFVIFLIFIESNIGFKWIVNFTSRFFGNFKTEEISGNWRNFTLKNVKYNAIGFCITAKNIHIILDISSLFKRFIIFKSIETKELIVSLKQNIFTDIIKDNISMNTIKRNIYIKYPIILRKIYADKILFKTSKVNLFFLNVYSGLELENNNIIFSPACIDAINIDFKNINYKKKNVIKKLNFVQKNKDTKNIYSLLYFFSQKPRIFIPFNINLNLLKCKKINFIYHKNYNFSYMELNAKIQNNIVKIKKIRIKSSFLAIQSSGKILFNNHKSILCMMNNQIFIPQLHKKNFKFYFKANLNDKFTFRLKSNNLYKIYMHGGVFLDGLDYPCYVNLHSKNLFWSIKKNFFLNLNNIELILKGKINNYSISLQNILSLQDMPSIFINLKGRGDLQSIFIKKFQFFPLKTKIVEKKIIGLKKNILSTQNILDLIGKINLIGESHHHKYNLLIPKINLEGSLMKKKFSMTGSIYYRNFNLLEIPKINLFAGDNKLSLRGLLGEQYNIRSFINANNLEYFSSDLKGKIKVKTHLRNDDKFSFIKSKIIASDLKLNSIFLKKIKMLTNINVKNMSGKILINTYQIDFSNFYINSLHFQMYWNSYKQKFCLLLNSPLLNIHVILNSSIDNKTGNWYGCFEQINIQTFFGKISVKNSPLLYSYDLHKNINTFYKNNLEIKNQFNFLLNQTRTYFNNIFNESRINFQSKLYIQAKLKQLTSEEKKYQATMIVMGRQIKLNKKIDGKQFIENIDCLKLSIHFIKNAFRTKWIIKKITNLSENKKIIGYLDIIDIYHKKNIIGKFFIHNFPLSFINFFTSSFKEIKGNFTTTINFLGTLYQPKISADVNFQNAFIKSDNLLQYTTLFFPYFAGTVDNVKINQEIVIKRGNILFKSNSFFQNSHNTEWNLIFNSKKIIVIIFPTVKLKFSSKLNLHYLLSKYDLMGYIRFSWFNFKIDERNFIF